MCVGHILYILRATPNISVNKEKNWYDWYEIY